MILFIMGNIGRLSVGESILYQGPSEGREVFGDKKVKIAACLRLERSYYAVQVKAGKAKETEGYYARVFPPDALEELSEHDEAIREAEAKVKQLYKERQDFLASNVVRGRLITVKDAVNAKDAKKE